MVNGDRSEWNNSYLAKVCCARSKQRKCSFLFMNLKRSAKRTRGCQEKIGCISCFTGTFAVPRREIFLFVHEVGERDRRRVNAYRGELVLLVVLYPGLVCEEERKREIGMSIVSGSISLSLMRRLRL